jgi:hypothetical protein|tara:strand:- start:176 stop:448 length:273 start_codon:yes stop_codon:yes gene_type:complete
MNDEEIRDQINELIRDEIQEVINDYVDERDESEKSGLGFVESEDELKVNINTQEIDKLIKQYKKLRKKQKSNITEIKKLGLLDKNGNPLK